MIKKYVYETCCMNCGDKVEALDKMIEEETEVSYNAMLRRCEGLLEWAKEKGYEPHPNQGLTLKNDWAVSFHRSKFDGLSCYYLQWSGIEFIWTKRS